MAVDRACDGLTRVLWVTARAPAVVVSGLIWCGLASQLGARVAGPGWRVVAGLVAGLLVGLLAVHAAAVMARRGWTPAQAWPSVMAVLRRTRLPSAGEERTLAETRRVLDFSGVDAGCVVVSRGPRRGAAVWARGRHQVVLSPALLVALSQRHIRGRDAAALIARVVGWQRAHPGRGSVLAGLWLLPWRVLSRPVSRAAAWAVRLPLVGFAWHARIVIGAIAIAQVAVSDPSSGPRGTAGQTGAGGPPVVVAALIAVVVVATYTTPAARRVYLTRVGAAADFYVEEHGSGQTGGVAAGSDRTPAVVNTSNTSDGRQGGEGAATSTRGEMVPQRGA